MAPQTFAQFERRPDKEGIETGKNENLRLGLCSNDALIKKGLKHRRLF